MKNKIKTRNTLLEYAPLIPGAPINPSQMHQMACQNDTVTVEFWSDIWVAQTKENLKRAGTFHENGIGKLFGHYKHKPVIVAGAGPSLRYNVKRLKDRDGIGLISCLHNFAFMEDNDAAPDFYTTLDSGEVTIEEVHEGGKRKPEWYWKRTKDRTLLAFVGTHPELIKKWQGKIYWFNCAIPDENFGKLSKEIGFNTFVGTGGNVLGATFYIAKAIMGANPVAFIGADFSFANYDVERPQFHGWKSKYDEKMGQTLRVFDIFGNSVQTWPSYENFRQWLHYVFSSVPGIYINCTEGGTLGAFPDGIMMQIPPMDLEMFLEMYSLHRHVENQCRNPKTDDKILLF